MDWKKKLDITKHDDHKLPKKNSTSKQYEEERMLKGQISHSIFNKDSNQDDIESDKEDTLAHSNAEYMKNLQMCFLTFFAFLGITSFFLSGNSIPTNTTYFLGIDLAYIYPTLQTINYLLMLMMIPPIYNNIRGSNSFTRSIFGFLPKYGKYKIGKILTTFMLTFTASTGISFLNSWGAFDPQPSAVSQNNLREEELINKYKEMVEIEHAKIQEMKHIAEARENAIVIGKNKALKQLEALKIQEAIADQTLKTQAKIDALNKNTKKVKQNNTRIEAENFYIQNEKMEKEAIKHIYQLMQENYKQQGENISK